MVIGKKLIALRRDWPSHPGLGVLLRLKVVEEWTVAVPDYGRPDEDRDEIGDTDIALRSASLLDGACPQKEVADDKTDSQGNRQLAEQRPPPAIAVYRGVDLPIFGVRGQLAVQKSTLTLNRSGGDISGGIIGQACLPVPRLRGAARRQQPPGGRACRRPR